MIRMPTIQPIKAPFPYFGGKARVAAEIWKRFGDVPNYVEPFAGSLAVLLSRPTEPHTETVNDLDGWLTNFWRAVRAEPEAVAEWADYPVSELDLHARGDWLFYRPDAAEFVRRMRTEPDYFDVKSAGWWLWGICQWIGTGWGPRQMPHVGDAGRGVNRQMPHVGDAGRGVNRKMPHVGNAGRGVNRKMPHVGNAGRGSLCEYMQAIADRLRRTRILCGEWDRLLGPSVTVRHGTTAVMLDPPYGDGAMDYAAGGNASDVATNVRDWAVANGDDPALRIAYCGYAGAVEFPTSWECLEWKNRGGYGSQGDGDGRDNAHRERIWFSPHCLKVGRRPVAADLFDLATAEE